MSVKCATGLLQGHPFSRSLSQRWELARTPADWSVAKEGSINDNDMTGSAVGSVIHLNGEELETNFGTGVGGSTLEMSRKDSLSFSARNTGRNNDPRAPLPPATAPAALLDSSIVFEITEEEQGKSIDDVWKNIQRSNSRSVDDDNMQQQGLVAGARPTIPCPQPCCQEGANAVQQSTLQFYPQQTGFVNLSSIQNPTAHHPVGGVSTIPSLPPLLNSQSLDLLVLQQQLHAQQQTDRGDSVARKGDDMRRSYAARRKRKAAVSEAALKASMQARIQKNRESAKRSRIKRQNHTAELERSVNELTEENHNLKQQIVEEMMAQTPKREPRLYDIRGRRTLSL